MKHRIHPFLDFSYRNPPVLVGLMDAAAVEKHPLPATEAEGLDIMPAKQEEPQMRWPAPRALLKNMGGVYDLRGTLLGSS